MATLNHAKKAFIGLVIFQPEFSAPSLLIKRKQGRTEKSGTSVELLISYLCTLIRFSL